MTWTTLPTTHPFFKNLLSLHLREHLGTLETRRLIKVGRNDVVKLRILLPFGLRQRRPVRHHANSTRCEATFCQINGSQDGMQGAQVMLHISMNERAAMQNLCAGMSSLPDQALWQSQRDQPNAAHRVISHTVPVPRRGIRPFAAAIKRVSERHGSR